MTPKFLKVLGFGDQLLISEKKILLKYAAHLLTRLARGEFGSPPEDPQVLNAFQDFADSEAANDKDLNDVLGQIKARNDLTESLLPAMLATVPPCNDLIDYDHFERIKAWMLFASTGLAIEYVHEHGDVIDEEDFRISCVHSAARRIRLMLSNKYTWMLKDLPEFNEEIRQLEESLNIIQWSYEDGDKIHTRAIGIIHTPISRYINHRLLKISRKNELKNESRRRLKPILIEPTPGMADSEFDYLELYEAPKRDVPRVSQRELEGDQATGSKYIQETKSSNKVEKQSLSMQAMQAKAIASRIAVREMRLPCDWGTLTRYESKTVLQECWSKAITGEPTDLMIVLCLLTGRPPDRLKKIIHRLNLAEPEGIIEKDNHVALSFDQSLPTPHIPGEASRLAENPSSTIYLILPDELYAPILSVKNDRSKLTDDLAKLISERISEINRRFKTRLTISRISGDLFSRAKRISNDSADIAQICGHSALQCPPLFYYSQNASNPSDLFLKSNAILFKDACIEPTYPAPKQRKGKFGSRLIIKDNFISALFNEQAKRIEKLRRRASSNPVAFHNEFSLYTYQLLMLGTGHRAVNCPFEKRKDIDLNRKTIWISDKEIRSGLTARTLVLPEIVCRQIRSYDEHLKLLRDRLSLDNHYAAARVKSAMNSKEPYLFWIAEHDAHDLFPSFLKAVLANRWPLPLNWQRHYMRSTLKLEGVPGDAVNAWMGHAKFGEEAQGPWSGLSFATLQKTAKVIESKFQILSIIPVIGLPAL